MTGLTVGEHIQIEYLDALVERHMAFIIRTVSACTGRYVSVEHDDAFSIALIAFAEAVERYDPQRGSFLPFAGLVMQSRVRTFLSQEGRHAHEVSLEALEESGRDFAGAADDDGPSLRGEIAAFQEELALFGLTIEVLADEAPRHKDTRDRAVDVAERSSGDSGVVELTYRKRKLPVRAISRLCGVTEKIVKGSKIFILATMLVFVKKLPGLMEWIRGTRCAHGG